MEEARHIHHDILTAAFCPSYNYSLRRRLQAKSMTTVAILPILSASGEESYHAIAGDKRSVGKTARQALDRLTARWVRQNSVHY